MAVPAPLARWRALAACAVALAGLAALPARPASAHGGDGLAQPIFETMSPTVAGVTVDIAFSANYQFLVSNTTPQTLTFLADSGEPFLEIGPEGVRGNLASPTFFDSNVPSGRQTFPPQARPGADVPPIWQKLSRQPNWGWYDHRLHPAESYIPPELQRARKVAVLGRWRVPLRLGDQAGELQGRFEYHPPTGSYGMVQKSPENPAPNVTIQVVSASRVPAIFVKNESSDPVVILGKDNEPFARIGPKVSEINVHSPTWAEIQQAQGKDPSDEADPSAAPKWQEVASTPAWNWLELRAAAPKGDPPAQIVEGRRATTVKTWSIPYLIGNRRGAIEGITEFIPLAVLAERTSGSTGDSEGNGSNLSLYAGAGLVAAVLAVVIWLVTSKVRNRGAA